MAEHFKKRTTRRTVTLLILCFSFKSWLIKYFSVASEKKWGNTKAHSFLPFTKVPKRLTDVGIYLSSVPWRGLGRRSYFPLLAYRIKAYAPGKTVAANRGRNTTHTFVQHFAPFLLPALSGSSIPSSHWPLLNRHHRSLRRGLNYKEQYLPF